MNRFFRVCFLVFIPVFFIVSCRPSETSPSSTQVSTVNPATPVVSETLAPTEVPNQKDLIFIEFFAGT